MWIGHAGSELGAQLSAFVLPLLAVTYFEASTLEVTALTALTWLPFLLFSLPAGLIADRWDLRRILVLSETGRVAVVGLIPLLSLVLHAQLWLLFVLVTLAGTLNVFFAVAHKSYLPRILAAGSLVDGNGKLGAIQSVAEMVGPSLAGVVVAAWADLHAIWAVALAYGFSALALSRLPRSRPDDGLHIRAENKDHESPWATVVDGFVQVKKDKCLRAILATTAVSNFFVVAMSAVEVLFLVRELGASPLLVGLIFSVGAIGSVVFGVLADRIGRWVGTARLIWLSMLVPGPLYFLMPLSESGSGLALYAVGLFAFAANIVMFNASAGAYRQTVVPSGLLGRVNATFLWIGYGVLPLGAICGGALAGWLGYRTALLISVIGLWAAAAFVFFSPLRHMRDFTPVDSQAEVPR